MRDLGRRLLIGLAAVVAGVAAIGYGLIAGGIAAPLGAGLGSVEVPPEPGAFPIQLDDGRPAWLVGTDDGAVVLDARAPTMPGEPGRLVGWCGDADGVFLDPLDGATYAADGALLGGPGDGGLLRYPIASSDGGRRLSVGRDAEPAQPSVDEPVALDCPPGTSWTTHRPEADEAFDPSVAADEEPPGWIWLRGTLLAIGGQALLCDGLGADCATGAVARGIDPAQVPGGADVLVGSFLGRARDGALEHVHFVPALGGTP